MRRAMIALAMGLASLRVGAAEPLDSLLAQASSACDGAYALKKVKNKHREVRRPVMMLLYDDKKAAWTISTPTEKLAEIFKNTTGTEKTPVSDFTPADADAVRSVACIKRGEPVEMGNYGAGKPAYGYRLKLMFLDWPSRKALAALDWEAKPPGDKKEFDSPYASTGPNDIAVWVVWLLDANY